ncbi:MAG TPA: histidine kinase [Jiangellaceae bacterium]|nr:histidine kinase [Jiangellaceae bacterium]
MTAELPFGPTVVVVRPGGQRRSVPPGSGSVPGCHQGRTYAISDSRFRQVVGERGFGALLTRGQPRVAGEVCPLDEFACAADDAGVSRWARVRQYTAIVVGGVGLLVAVGFALYARLPSLWGTLVWTGVTVLPLYVVAVWLVRRRPDHPQARRLLLVAAAQAAGVGLESVVRGVYQESGPNGWLWVANLAHQYTYLLAAVAGGVLLASYPDGVVERHWQRWVVRAMWWQLALPPLLLVTQPNLVISPYLLDAPPQIQVASPFAVTWLAPVGRPLELLYVSYAGALLGILVLLIRYQQADRVQRRQMRLLVYTMAAGVPVVVAAVVMTILGVPEDSYWLQLVGLLYIPIALMIPVSIVVGVMRYRLFDIDLVIRRSVVYGALTIGIAAGYIGLAAAPGLALGNQIPVELAVILTVLAAVAFNPLRRRLESVADRWVFGERINRYQLLTSFGATLEQTVDLADLLPRLAETVRRGLGAAWVRVSLRGELAEAWLTEPQGVAGATVGTAEITEELRHADEVVGRIECGPSDEGYDQADRELLATLSGQAATAIANVRLAAHLREQVAELARSRARIVAAQDTERRRIERDIHDGVQQEVVALIAKLRLARNRLGRGETPEMLLAELQADAGELLADLRELAHGIHPPVLSDGGLVAAVEARAGRLPLDVTVRADEALRSRRLDADVEAAAYFVICEALTNVVKHARAERALVQMSAVNGELSLLVHDDGTGLSATNGNGQGLTNLRDRVEAVGGHLRVDGRPGEGTSVSAELPVGAPDG